MPGRRCVFYAYLGVDASEIHTVEAANLRKTFIVQSMYDSSSSWTSKSGHCYKQYYVLCTAMVYGLNGMCLQ